MEYALERKQMNIIEYDKKFTVTLYSRDTANAKKYKPDDFEFIMPLGRGAFG